MQLALFSLQKSDRSSDVRCVVSKERKVACRLNLVVEKPKGGQAKESLGAHAGVDASWPPAVGNEVRSAIAASCGVVGSG